MDLDGLRSELADVDRELVRLMARRQEIAAGIGRVKRETGAPPRDYGQEREVIQRGRRLAVDSGTSPDLAEAVLLKLIESSLTVQEREQVASSGAGDGRRALVIGGCGRMGRWFARFLGSQGYVVEVADPAGPIPGCAHQSDWRATDLQHELIVVAAPLRESAAILVEMSHDPPPGIVCDIGSLKTPLRESLETLARSGARVASIHPMFGPDTELLSGRHVIFVDLGVGDANAEARELFAATMAIQVEMDMESHDRLIAYILGVSHALNIAFFAALGASGEAASKLDRLSSTTFDQQLRIAENVAGESPGLYFEIQSLNPYGKDALGSLASAVETLRGIVDRGDEAAFERMMRSGREYLAALRG